ncbi:MAG: bifunctional 3-demethylubiquinone-9 3-methyltransferase/2-octaprenyl-6-hydroxy phenol methylase [Myxococcaceae bacterium]|nr:bifunctional 3-demethylubiquinone-9 3-methyltransferase/2-octaprenyl-6-hydroxy phenol methylase [Myxococcaceae bacterium]
MRTSGDGCLSARDECGVCGAPRDAGRTVGYDRCRDCGHEARRGAGSAIPMINELLDAAAVRRGSVLGAFRARAAASCAVEGDTLLDVGCGAGAFLYAQRDRFRRVVGVEVSPSSRDFARRELGLRVEPAVPSDLSSLSLVTFWHSLEHLSLEQIGDALARVRAQSSSATRVIVSVPNAGSALYRLVGERYPYFDLDEHPQQFTADSLDRVMARGGFAVDRRLFVLDYAAFGYLQGLLNCVASPRNHLYGRLKRGAPAAGSAVRRAARDVGHGALAAAFLPAALALCLHDRARAAKGAVLTVCYRLAP